MMKNRYGTNGVNYKFGNPLIGMSLADIAPHVDIKNQPGLFSKNPLDLLVDLRQMYRQYFSLSEKIREDMAIREELGIRLKQYRERLRDVMDLITATYFSRAVDEKKIQEFWTGRSFNRPDEGQDLSYHLAQFLVQSLARNFQSFKQFVLQAHFEDSGESAARAVYNNTLGYLIEGVLGEGEWSPKR